MTTLQLIERIARRTKAGDFTKLAQTEILDCLQAANAALQRAYNASPAYLKELTQGFTLPPPATLYNVSVTNGSTQLSTGIFSAAQLGCTVQIAGDPQFNQVLGSNILRNPYNGPTGIVATMTIYGDALYSTSYPFDRIIGNPRFTDQQVVPLVPQEMSHSEGEWSYLFQNTLGRPMTWWTQMMGNSQGSNPVLVIKFAPFPDQAYSIKIRLSFWPVRLLITDIQAATTLNVPDQLLEKGLLPMAIQELMTTPVWKSISDKDDDRVEARGIAAEEFIRLQIADVSAPSNKIYCPLGF